MGYEAEVGELRVEAQEGGKKGDGGDHEEGYT